MLKNIDQTETLEFSLPAMRVHQREQKGKAIYVARISAKELSVRADERFKIAYYSRVESTKDIGYQRPLSQNAVEKIKDFILKKESENPLLPTALLVNSRNVLDFKDTGGGIGTLNVKGTLYVIDGQHRYEAWKQLMEDPELLEQYGDYELPLVILSGFFEYQEIEQFYIINSKQKRIKTDLAQRHLLALAGHPETERLVPSGKHWELFATKIADLLNEQFDGDWKKKIILADDKPDLRKTKFISQSSFVSSMKPFFTGSDPVFKKEEGVNNLNGWAKIILDCWNIVGKYYPNATKNTRDYSLMKTVGVFSLHILFAKILSDIENLPSALQKIDSTIKRASENGYGESFWRVKQPQSVKDEGKYAGAYSNAVGHKRIAQGMMFGEL